MYYTYETYRLRLEAQKQTNEAKQQSIASIRPYLRLQWAYNDGLVIVNEGNGVAVNLVSSSNDLNRDVRLNKISAVGAKGSTMGLPKDFKAQKDWLDPNKAQYIIHIQFQNAESKRYFAKFKTNTTYNDGFEILEQGEL